MVIDFVSDPMMKFPASNEPNLFQPLLPAVFKAAADLEVVPRFHPVLCYDMLSSIPEYGHRLHTPLSSSIVEAFARVQVSSAHALVCRRSFPAV